MSRASTPQKATLGGKDAQDNENSGPYYSDLKIANNYFEVFKGVALEFGGRSNSPLFYLD